MMKCMFELEKWGMIAWNFGHVLDSNIHHQGIEQRMLNFAENNCKENCVKHLHLSTSETQPTKRSLYTNIGIP